MNASVSRNIAMSNNSVYKSIKAIINSAALDGNTEVVIDNPTILTDFIDNNRVSDIIYEQLTNEGYQCGWNKYSHKLTITF